MPTSSFHPIVRSWFEERFGQPTEPQRRGWPEIAAGRHTLIAAPTGSGKTLAAFMVCIDRLLRRWLEGRLDDHMVIVYVSPLKALGNDIERNLQTPLAEIRQRCEEEGYGVPEIRTAVRSGDTPARERQAMLRRPPHILVTTPESLYLLLTSEKGRQIMQRIETVIIDEIHALARDKRGSHLSLSLARLDALCDAPPVRIGLSATQRPMDEIARFLVGTTRVDASGTAGCSIVDVGHARELDLAVEVPPRQLEAICSHEQWADIYARLTKLIHAHRSTLIFVNTRRFAERVAHHLTSELGEDAVASHHGSLSRQIRQSAERRLKAGELKAIVATASLELGIDIGFIDLVCQIGSPRSIATLLQRVGRSGHSLGALPCGRLFPLTRDELIECLALIRAARQGELDQIEIPVAPLDILAQQIVAAVACETWEEERLLELCRSAWPYRNLSRDDFEDVVKILSEGFAPRLKRGRHLHRDAIGRRLRARRGARLVALTSGGAIPETAQYRVLAEPDQTFVGQVDEDFAIESLAGDIFLLGNTSWQIRQIKNGQVIVRDAGGAPPNIPFWFGEAPGRTVELSAAVSQLRADLAADLASRPDGGDDPTDRGDGGVDANHAATQRLIQQCKASAWAAQQAVDYVAAQQAAIGLVPTQKQIVFERFFDESGGMQLVIHAPLGARINRAWGLALRKRFCRSFDFELQASATDDGIVLSIGPQHSFPIESLFGMLSPDNGRELLEQAVMVVPMFQVRWRWNVTRALGVLRQRGGSKVPPYLQRFQSDDLLAAVFPESVGCLENHHGDIPIPDHPMIRQTMQDCLQEAMDLDRWLALLSDIQENRVQLIARDTREPSPFSHELLNANPYAFLDGAPLEERRTRAVITRRSLSLDELSDLGQLDPEAIAQVTREAAPVVRDAEELHDALLSLVVVSPQEAHAWSSWMDELVSAGRATLVTRGSMPPLWIAAERWPVVSAVWKEGVAKPAVSLPPALNVPWESATATVELLRGQMAHAGPTTAGQLAARLGLRQSQVGAALEALEGEGMVLRGHFHRGSLDAPARRDTAEVQWCDRRLLARIHRLTLDGLRRQIQPVEPHQFVQFLLEYHRVLGKDSWGGLVAVRETVQALQGFELPAGAWETHVLPARVHEYQPEWLDQLFLTGQLTWGRLCPTRRETENGRSSVALTRTVPISLLLREDMGWLLSQRAEPTEQLLRSNDQLVLGVLRDRGALFTQELIAATGLLPGHVEEAFRDLAALGLVTADTFAAVRQIVAGPHGNGRRQQRKRNLSGQRIVSTASGRWSCFPGLVTQPTKDQYLENWCRQLMRRWGIVFRELLAREASAPPWQELVPTFRSLERRGEIRGGRFVSKVAGEQYGTNAAVEGLRKSRDQAEGQPWVAISAADPLNLVGIVTAAPARIPATYKNALVLDEGRCIASLQAGRVEFHEDVEPFTRAEMQRALQQGRRPSSSRLVPRRRSVSRR